MYKDVLKHVIDKEITVIDFSEERLLLTFANNITIKIWDSGQCCCEHRYLTSDDDIQAFVGASLVRVEKREAPDVERRWGAHEVAFLIVTTGKGVFTIETHNEHNGYYGGFLLSAEII